MYTTFIRFQCCAFCATYRCEYCAQLSLSQFYIPRPEKRHQATETCEKLHPYSTNCFFCNFSFFAFRTFDYQILSALDKLTHENIVHPT